MNTCHCTIYSNQTRTSSQFSPSRAAAAVMVARKSSSEFESGSNTIKSYGYRDCLGLPKSLPFVWSSERPKSFRWSRRIIRKFHSPGCVHRFLPESRRRRPPEQGLRDGRSRWPWLLCRPSSHYLNAATSGKWCTFDGAS
ncbi:uncharacterized protein LOC117649177 isoform X3 [Thrips palmi]|uniref:Uncharacterized protein LOC117649177 isoform X3 n=1 Tax=Thrips palmi TaxID=161013 RepID=A0A6P8ZA42_THRPL|nr:uncharacterized protein LOC117649177 isoform X3 [Thrips palmi]